MKPPAQPSNDGMLAYEMQLLQELKQERHRLQLEDEMLDEVKASALGSVDKFSNRKDFFDTGEEFGYKPGMTPLNHSDIGNRTH